MEINYVIIVRKTGTTYKRIWKKRILAGKNEVKYRGKTKIVDLARPVWTQGNSSYYVMDMVNGQVFLEGNAAPINDGLIDTILSTSTIKQAVASTGGLWGIQDLLKIVIGLIAGIPLGIILAPFIGG